MKNRNFSKEIENLSKEIENLKSQMEILNLKNLVPKPKISVNGLNTKLEEAEERINELEDRTIEITKTNQQRENRLEKKKKRNRASGTCGTMTKDLTYMSLESQKKRGKREGLKKYKK